MVCNCFKRLDSGFRRNDGLRLGEKRVLTPMRQAWSYEIFCVYRQYGF
ncbi:MAG: hypothetical protein R6U40_12755 [Desulfobacterales bacterium]